jgi:hypothetical protein
VLPFCDTNSTNVYPEQLLVALRTLPLLVDGCAQHPATFRSRLRSVFANTFFFRTSVSEGGEGRDTLKEKKELIEKLI